MSFSYDYPQHGAEAAEFQHCRETKFFSLGGPAYGRPKAALARTRSKTLRAQGTLPRNRQVLERARASLLLTRLFCVAQVSKPAVPQTSKSASGQQVWKPALQS
jgi:hypothetical protein